MEVSSTEMLSENQVIENEKINELLLAPSKRNEKQITQLISQIPEIDKHFNIHRKIGQGTFSTVFLASLRSQQHVSVKRREYFAIKHLIPTSHPNRIERELKCLQQIGGTDNVIGIDLCLRRYEFVAFIMPYASHDKFQDFYDNLTPKETRNYIKNLLIALRRVHNFNIIHRDVKPSNFLYDRKNSKYLLVDFGLAQELSLSKLKNGEKCEEEELINMNKRKLENDDNDNDEILSGNTNIEIEEHKNSSQKNIIPTIKRARYSNNHVPNTKIENSENSQKCVQSSRQQQLLISSPFKTPLKQFNEILSRNNKLLNGKFCLPSPIETNIKSAVLGLNLNMLMQKESGGVEDNVNLNTTNTSTPPAKYNTDNRKISKTPTTCYCYGKNMICNICVIKKEMVASRAGTSGYRPPEVLLKSNDQDTGVDIWAAGVILISILSKCYPFFKATDDFTALAEIITVFGDGKIKKTARLLNRQINLSCKKDPLHLRKLCIRLRHRFTKKTDPDQTLDSTPIPYTICTNCQQIPIDCLCANSLLNTDFSNDEYSELAYDLLSKLLEINPKYRITASDALNHPYFKESL